MAQIQMEAWPGGWQSQALQDLITQINTTNNNISTVASSGEIGAGFDARPYPLSASYTPPVQVVIPYKGTITQCAVVADQIGSCVISILKTNLASFPVYTNIVALTPPTLAGVEISLDVALLGWDKEVIPGDLLLFGLTSSSTIQQVTVALAMTKKS